MPEADLAPVHLAGTAALGAALTQRLSQARTRAGTDPFTSAPLLFALELSREMESGKVRLDTLEAVVSQLTAEAFIERAGRLAAYLGDCAPERLRERLDALFEVMAARGDFAAYARPSKRLPSDWC